MFSAARNIWSNLSEATFGPVDDNGDNGDSGSDTDSEITDSDAQSYGGFYRPTVADVLVAKAMLQRGAHLPLELVDDIVDYAEYWPHTHAEIDYSHRPANAIVIPPRSFRNVGNNEFLLRTPPLGFRRAPPKSDGFGDYTTDQPLPRPVRNADDQVSSGDVLCTDDDVRTWLPAGTAPPLEYPCRKIVFTLVSHDQGWANNQRHRGQYQGSYSWFDVGLERYGRPASVPRDKEEKNEQKDDAKEKAHEIPPDASLYTLRPDVVEKPADDQNPTGGYQFSFPLLPGVDRLQSNLVATRAWTEHKIVWSWTDDVGADATISTTTSSTDPTPGADNNDPHSDTESEQDQVTHPLERMGRGGETGDGSFIKNMRVGDVVTLWAKARFPGWVNMVQRAEVDVYWAV